MSVPRGLLALALVVGSAAALPCADTAQPNHCENWAAAGECESNSGFMHHRCRLACNLCTPMDPLQLLSDVDKDNSTTISKSELLARHAIVTELRAKRDAAQRAAEQRPPPPSWESESERADFASADVDKNGFLTTNETFLEPGADEVDDSMDVETLHLERELDMVMFTHADKDRDGLLSPQEYVQFRHGDFESNPAFQDVMRKMDLHHAEQQFNKWDTDKSGELDEEEVFDAIETGGLEDLTHPEELKDEL